MSSGWKKFIYGTIAGRLSSITRYYDALIQWKPRGNDSRLLFDLLDCGEKRVVEEGGDLPDLSGERERRTAILLNGTFNYNYDIQGLLLGFRPKLSRNSRVLVVAYNPYLSWLYKLANRIGLRKGDVPTTFITRVDLENIASLAGYAIERTSLAVYFPWRLFGLGTALNRLLSVTPVLRWLAFVYLAVLRPKIADEHRPSLSCVIPARNERGNIENALKRFPELGCRVEIIFVEGHSSDGTWDEILRVKELYRDRFEIKCFQQSGKGKSDAVRLGFAHATGELLTILDADLTMPPELLGRFYDAYVEGHADFVNGSRLLYPMEGEAMRFLNHLGNVFFAKALSWTLDTRLGDSLCGTKLFSSHDYRRMIAWRHDFGDFDPFGDFEIIFPAAVLGLGIVDVPVRYLDRSYGSTSISRFRHGFMLLKMMLIGVYKIKLGAFGARSRLS